MRKVTWGVVVVGVVAIPLVWLGHGLATPDQQQLDGMESVRVGRRDVGTSVKATGVVKPMVGAEVKVGSRVSGVVARLHVRIGDTVRKGQLLAELDDRELVARRDQAAAALASARAQLDYAVTDLARKRELAASQLIAEGDLDLAERAHAVARQQCAEADANLAYARIQLAYARIAAPISGIVSSVATQEGETVSASLAAPTFVTLIDLGRLEVWAYVDETDIGRIRLGQKARFTVDTYPDDAFDGTVTAVYPQPEIRDNVVNYVTVLSFATPAGRTLRPEMTTTVTLDVERHAGVLTVPRGAVHRDEGRTFVYRQTGDRVEARPVTLGARDDSSWEIVAGLQEGDTVVVGRAGAHDTLPR